MKLPWSYLGLTGTVDHFLYTSELLLRPHGLESTVLFCPWDFPCKNTGAGSHFLLHGIFQDQGLNPLLLHWQVDSLPLSHQGSPNESKALIILLKFYICELNSLKYSFFPCLQGINNAYHVLMKKLIHLSENSEIQEATDMQYQCSLNYIYYGLTQ